MTWTTASLGRADHIDEIVEAAKKAGKTHRTVRADDLKYGDILFPAAFTITSTHGCPVGDSQRVVLGFCPGQISHRLLLSADEEITVLR